ncbi:hypothetical protein JNK13_01925 [bacterium]|nr:hypothetical protein [bacterium]
MRFRLILTITLLLIFSACGSARIGQKIALPEIAGISVTRDSSLQDNEVYLEQVGDARTSPVLMLRGSSEVTAEGSATQVVEQALKRVLSDKGFSVTEGAPIVIRAELVNWTAELSSGMAMRTVSSAAEIKLTILDPTNKAMYIGTYRGSSNVKNPKIEDAQVREALQISMSQALQQVAADGKLLNLLTSF